jgi:hypothetical protein
MDARRPPKRIFHTHLPDKIAQFTIDLGSATQITGLPAPPGPKSRPMPANHSLRACVFHGILGGDSTGRWAAIPRHRGQGFHAIVGTLI